MNIREKIVQIKFIKIKTLFSRKLKPAECIKGNAQQYNNVRDSPILPFSLKKQMMASLFNVIQSIRVIAVYFIITNTKQNTMNGRCLHSLREMGNS